MSALASSSNDAAAHSTINANSLNEIAGASAISNGRVISCSKDSVAGQALLNAFNGNPSMQTPLRTSTTGIPIIPTLSSTSATQPAIASVSASPPSPYSLTTGVNAPGILAASLEAEYHAQGSTHSSPTIHEHRIISSAVPSSGVNISRLPVKSQQPYRVSMSAASGSGSMVPINSIHGSDYRPSGSLKRSLPSEDDSASRSAKPRLSSSSSSRAVLPNVHSNCGASPSHSHTHYQQYSNSRGRMAAAELLEEEEFMNLEDMSEAESDLHSDPRWTDGISSSSSPRPPSNPTPSLFGIRSHMPFTLMHPVVFIRYQYLKGHADEKIVIQAKHTPVFCFSKETNPSNAAGNAAMANDVNAANAAECSAQMTNAANSPDHESASFLHSFSNCIHLVRQSDILQVLSQHSVEYDVRAGICVKLAANFFSPSSNLASPSSNTISSGGPAFSSLSCASSVQDVHTTNNEMKLDRQNDKTPMLSESEWFNMKEQEFLPVESFLHPHFGQAVVVSVYLQSCSNSRSFLQQISKRLMNIEQALHQQQIQETTISPRSPTQPVYPLAASHDPRDSSPQQHPVPHPYPHASSAANADDHSSASASSSAATSSSSSNSSSSAFPLKLAKKKLSSAETIGDILDRLDEFHRIAAETGSPTEAYRIAGFAKGTISGYRAKIKEIQDEIGADLSGYRHMTYRDLKKMVRSGRHAANLQFSLAAANAVPPASTMPPHPSLVHPSMHHHGAPPAVMSSSNAQGPLSSTIRPWKSPSSNVHPHSLPRVPSSSHLISYSSQPPHHSAHHSHPNSATHENIYTRHYLRS